MMPAARANIDMAVGVCCAHDGCIPTSGSIMMGSPNVLVNMLPAARMSDIVMGSCGHIAMIISAAVTVRTNFMGKARMGDQVSGVWQGTIVGGSPNVLVGG